MTPTTTTAEPTTTVQGEAQVSGFKIYWRNVNRKFYLYNLVPDCAEVLISSYFGDVDIQDGQIGYFQKVFFHFSGNFYNTNTDREDVKRKIGLEEWLSRYIYLLCS